MKSRLYAARIIGFLTGTVGDVIQAPHEQFHRATSRAPGMATRLAITPRNKEGQVHYYQPDAAGGDNQ
jgi:hypothetical protein